MNRGLIEASVNGMVTDTRDALPRFMNRGLIEAFNEARPVSVIIATSPIHESGPH